MAWIVEPRIEPLAPERLQNGKFRTLVNWVRRRSEADAWQAAQQRLAFTVWWTRRRAQA